MKAHALNVLVGIVLGLLIYWLTSSFSSSVLSDYPFLLWMAGGGFIGLVVGGLWPMGAAFVMSHRFADWRLHEVEFQGMKFTTAGAQRRTAWLLFVEMTTRTATQPMGDEEGENSRALESLYELFQLTRRALSGMEPTPRATRDTVETYALDMLNSDLRPFLSKWHRRWNEFKKGDKVGTKAWPDQGAFRAELRQLQDKIQGRARGLAQIAGVKAVDRFFQRRES